MSRAKRTKRTKRERFVEDAHAAPQDDAIDWLVNTTGYVRLQVPPDGKCLLHCFAAATARTVDKVLLDMKQCFKSNPQLEVEGISLLNCVYEDLGVSHDGVDWALWIDAYYANLPASHCDIFSIMLGAKALNLSVQIYDGTFYHDPRTSRRGGNVTYCSVSPLRCAGIAHGEIQVHLLRKKLGKGDYHYDLLTKEAGETPQAEVAEEIENKEIDENEEQNQEQNQETKGDEEVHVDVLATPPTSPQQPTSPLQQATASAQHYFKTYDGTLPDGYKFPKEVTQALKRRANVSLYYDDQFLNTVTFVEANVEAIVEAKGGGKKKAKEGGKRKAKGSSPFAAFYLVENHTQNRDYLPPSELAASQAYVAFKQRLLLNLNLSNTCPAVIFVAKEDVTTLWQGKIGGHDSLKVVRVSAEDEELGTGLLREALEHALPSCDYLKYFEEFAVVAAFHFTNN